MRATMALKNIGIDLFKNIMAEARHNSDLLDSYSPNQFKSKENLINHIDGLNVLNENSEIIILGSWYGSILVPAFKYVKKITMVDIDSNVMNIAKNRLFSEYKNIDYVVNDAFEWANGAKRMITTNLIINTSCEHMMPMNNLTHACNTYFAFQSNNMFNIPTHINCVHTLEQFERQLPVGSKVLIKDEIEDDRGTRFTLIGKLCIE